ncbi:FGGY carbohydrate kinase domain-containing protein-like, partial [Homalodisca vitripennis]|uniref:FGGY carbohydrate kinase domain-containing protein-like n=1 Tax=Homalodisca vitripennis TaxID=197043 RepID=UPI001EEA04FA
SDMWNFYVSTWLSVEGRCLCRGCGGHTTAPWCRGLWLSEGGQSATGRLLDHIIDTHPATASLRARTPHMHVVTYLNELLNSLANSAGLDSVDLLTKDLHVWPDHHGNRSPLADPTLRGMVSGLSLSCDEKDLALLYLATVQALAYGTRHIIESLESAGHRRMDCVLLCGGLSKNPLFMADTSDSGVGRPVLVPQRTEAVLSDSAVQRYWRRTQPGYTLTGGSCECNGRSGRMLCLQHQSYQ